MESKYIFDSCSDTVHRILQLTIQDLLRWESAAFLLLVRIAGRLFSKVVSLFLRAFKQIIKEGKAIGLYWIKLKLRRVLWFELLMIWFEKTSWFSNLFWIGLSLSRISPPLFLSPLWSFTENSSIWKIGWERRVPSSYELSYLRFGILKFIRWVKISSGEIARPSFFNCPRAARVPCKMKPIVSSKLTSCWVNKFINECFKKAMLLFFFSIA